MVDIIIKYLQTNKATNVQIIGHYETKTTFHNINETTKERYLINVFKYNGLSTERPLDIYNNQIEYVYFNSNTKSIKIKLKEEQQ